MATLSLLYLLVVIDNTDFLFKKKKKKHVSDELQLL